MLFPYPRPRPAFKSKHPVTSCRVRQSPRISLRIYCFSYHKLSLQCQDSILFLTQAPDLAQDPIPDQDLA